VTGPARSGKSEWAETLAGWQRYCRKYPDPADSEEVISIEYQHAARGSGVTPADLTLVENPNGSPSSCLLVDSLLGAAHLSSRMTPGRERCKNLLVGAGCWGGNFSWRGGNRLGCARLIQLSTFDRFKV